MPEKFCSTFLKSWFYTYFFKIDFNIFLYYLMGNYQTQFLNEYIYCITNPDNNICYITAGNNIKYKSISYDTFKCNECNISGIYNEDEDDYEDEVCCDCDIENYWENWNIKTKNYCKKDGTYTDNIIKKTIIIQNDPQFSEPIIKKYFYIYDAKTILEDIYDELHDYKHKYYGTFKGDYETQIKPILEQYYL